MLARFLNPCEVGGKAKRLRDPDSSLVQSNGVCGEGHVEKPVAAWSFADKALNQQVPPVPPPAEIEPTPAVVEATPGITPKEQSTLVGKGEKKRGRPAKSKKAGEKPKTKTKPTAKAKAKGKASKGKSNKDGGHVKDDDASPPTKRCRKKTSPNEALAGVEPSASSKAAGSEVAEKKGKGKKNRLAKLRKKVMKKIKKNKKGRKAKKVQVAQPSESSDKEQKVSEKKAEQKQRNARKSAAYRRAFKVAKDQEKSEDECKAAGRKVLWFDLTQMFNVNTWPYVIACA